jgi:hypothetical protein
MSDLEELIVVTHPVHTEIDEREVRRVVSGACTILACVEIRPQSLTLESTENVDWDALANVQRREWDSKIVPLLAKYPTAKLAYFGLAPIPLAMHLGSLTERLLGLRVFQRHHLTKRWEYTGGVDPEVTPLVGAADLVRSPDPVIVTVSTTAEVDIDEARKYVGATSAEMEVATIPLGEDVLSSEQSVAAVAQTFRRALEKVEQNRPRTEEIHVFAAVPCGLAFLLGSQITSTRDARVVTYQYYRSSEPRYRRALCLPIRSNPVALLTDEQRLSAAETRAAWERERQRTVGHFGHKGPWWTILGELGKAFDSGPFSKLQALPDTPLACPIASDVSSVEGELRYDDSAQHWILGDGLVSAIRAKLSPSEIDRAGRMLLLHEALHHGKQGLTGGAATMIRLAPKVLEELDYLADTWAMMHEFALEGLPENQWPEQRADLLRIIETAVATMWAFDAARELGELEVRRVNRYLMWYFQLARLERASNVADAMRIMAEKPVVELIGPEARLRDGRYVLALERDAARPAELCFLDRDGRLCRVGTTNAISVGDLARALGRHDSAQVRSLVRAFVGQCS